MSSSDLHLAFFFFFFNDTATTEIYTLSLHDALPISGAGEVPLLVVAFGTLQRLGRLVAGGVAHQEGLFGVVAGGDQGDRKSTRLNSSHGYISYAVFCLKKKKVATPWGPHLPHPGEYS